MNGVPKDWVTKYALGNGQVPGAPAGGRLIPRRGRDGAGREDQTIDFLEIWGGPLYSKKDSG